MGRCDDSLVRTAGHRVCLRFAGRNASQRAVPATTAEPNKVQLEARLTAEGDNYLAEAVTTTDSLSIYVVASNDPNFQCKGSAPPTLAAPSDVVELRLIREPAKAE